MRAPVWCGIVVARTVDAAGGYVSAGLPVDSLAPRGRIHVAEAVSGALSPYRVWLPSEDPLLLARARRYGHRAAGLGPGILAVLPDESLALGVSPRAAIESTGERLAAVSDPGRYTEFWTLPGVAYLERDK